LKSFDFLYDFKNYETQAIKNARVNYIVALNKIDKPNANIERTKKALFDAGKDVEPSSL